MRTTPAVLLALAALTLPAGCGSFKGERAPLEEARGGDATVAETAATPQVEVIPLPERRLVKRASLSLETGDIAAFRKGVEAVARTYKGFVASMSGSEARANATLRVASDRLDDALGDLEKLGSVESRHVSAEDVTEQSMDLEARHHNLVVVRDRLRALLEKATTAHDILEIQKELGRVEGDLEAHEARLKHLNTSVALSEVYVTAERPRILGPVGYLGWGLWWVVSKLFVIR